MKGKKGEEILTPMLLKVIIAVICVFILGYLAVQMYGIFTFNSKIGEANALLENIFSEIDYMKSKVVNEKTMIISTPRDWYLLGISGEEKKLCVCKELFVDSEKQKEECEINGVCKITIEEIIISTSTFDGNIRLEGIREITLSNEEGKFFIYTKTKQIKHKEYLNDFLEKEITVGGKKLKVYEQMIEIIEGRSKIGIEDSAVDLINEFDKIFGERGWAIMYTKEGKAYKENYIKMEVWENAKGYVSLENPGNIESALEEKITYDGGVLKVQMRILNKN